MLLGISMIGVAETMNLGIKCEFDSFQIMFLIVDFVIYLFFVTLD